MFDQLFCSQPTTRQAKATRALHPAYHVRLTETGEAEPAEDVTAMEADPTTTAAAEASSGANHEVLSPTSIAPNNSDTCSSEEDESSDGDGDAR